MWSGCHWKGKRKLPEAHRKSAITRCGVVATVLFLSFAKMCAFYAVVQFMGPEDNGEVSEIPESWLINNEECWWPPPGNKRSATLIKKNVLPDVTRWRKCVIKVERKGLSWDAARKRAEYIDYSSCNEQNTGRGKREKKKATNSDYTQDFSSSEDGSGLAWRKLTNVPLPRFPKDLPSQKSNDSSVPDSLTTFSEESNGSSVDLNGNTLKNNSGAQSSISNTVNKERKFQYRASSKNRIGFPAVNLTQEKDQTFSSLTNSQKGDQLASADMSPRIISLDINDIPIVFDNNILESPAPVNKECNCLKQMSDQLTKILKQNQRILQGLENRLNNLEISSQRQSQVLLNDPEIEEYLPLTNETDVANLEQYLSDERNLSKFRKYFREVGGNHCKEYIHRVLKKTFTNEFAMRCSWCGLRNNFKVSNLIVMKEIKIAAMKSYDLTEKNFENIASEWFRFSKQRHTRDVNKN